MKIALGIEYNGTHYFGWQRQANVTSVQKNWKVVSFVANEFCQIYCAGRTIRVFMLPVKWYILTQK